MSENARWQELRWLLSHPNPQRWSSLMRLLDDWPRGEGLARVLEETRAVVDDWPDAWRELRIDNYLYHGEVELPNSWEFGRAAGLYDLFRHNPHTGECMYEAPWLGQLTYLTRSYQGFGEEHLDFLCTHPLLGPLKGLVLDGCSLSLDALARLLDAPALAQLEVLILNNNELGDDAARLLAQAPFASSLRFLGLRSCSLTPAALPLLARGHFAALKGLRLDWNKLGGELGSLLAAPWFGSLESLDLSGYSGLTVADMRAFQAHEGDCRLVSLGLSHCQLGDVHMKVLAKASMLSGLRALQLFDNEIGDAGVKALAQSRQMAALEVLCLGGYTSFQDDHLVDFDPLSSLQRLRDDETLEGGGSSSSSRCNAVGPKGCRAIANARHMRSLRYLSLSGNPVGDDGVKALAKGSSLAHLEHLELCDIGLSARGLSKLLASTSMPALLLLNLEEHSLTTEELLHFRRSFLGAPHFAHLRYLRFSWDWSYPTGHPISRIFRGDPGLEEERRLSFYQETLEDEDIARIVSCGLLAQVDCLVLRECALTLEVLEQFLRSPLGQGLEILCIEGAVFGDEGAVRIAQSPGLSGLQELTLERCEMTSKGLEALLQAPFCAGLTSLRLKGNQLDLAASHALVACAALGNLRTLSLDGCQLSEEAMLVLAEGRHWTQLERLFLYGNESSHRTRRAFLQAPALRGLTTLEHRDCYGERILQVLQPWLCHEGTPAEDGLVDLRETRLDDDDLERILQAPQLAQVRELDLRKNGLTARGIRLLAEAEVGSLTRLLLDHNPLGDLGAKSLAQGESLRQLIHLHLADCEIGESGLRALAQAPLHALEHLDLRDNPGSYGAKHDLLTSTSLVALRTLHLQYEEIQVAEDELSLALKHSPTLAERTSLSLRGLKDAEVERILQNPHLRQLRQLDFSYSSLSDLTLYALARATHLEQLESLDLRYCSNSWGGSSFGPGGLRALRQAPHLGRLHTLCLGHNPLGREGLALILEAPHWQSLRHLELEGCEIKAGKGPLLGGEPTLKRLQSLVLEDNELGLADMLCLFEAKAFVAMQECRLSFGHLSSEDAMVLACAPTLSADVFSQLLGEQTMRTLRAWVKARIPGRVKTSRKSALIEALEGLQEEMQYGEEEWADCRRKLFAGWPWPSGWEHLDADRVQRADPAMDGVQSAHWLTLRELLATPCEEHWHQLWDFFEETAHQEGHALRLEYARNHLASWPVPLCNFRLDSLLPLAQGLLPASWEASSMLTLSASGWNSQVLRELMQSPAISHFRALCIEDNLLQIEDLQAIIASPHLQGLHTLRLRGNGLMDAALEPLLGWSQCEELETLELSNQQLSDAGVRMLAACETLPRLHTLRLDDNVLGEGVAALVQAPQRHALRHLSLGANLLSPTAIEALCRSQGISRLESLDLRANPLPSASISVLARAPFSSLRHLDLSRGTISDDGFEALQEASAWKELRSLSIVACEGKAGTVKAALRTLWRLPLPRLETIHYGSDYYPGTSDRSSLDARLFSPYDTPPLEATLHLGQKSLRDEELAALAACPRFADVRELNLRVNLFSSVGLRDFLKSPYLGGLRALSLDLNAIGDDWIPALADATMPALRTLSLVRVQLSDAGLKMLCEIPWMRQLEHLDLQENPALTEASVDAFLETEVWQGLQTLSCSPHALGGDTALSRLVASPTLRRRVKQGILEGLRLEELRRCCKQHRVRGSARMRKAQLVEAILASVSSPLDEASS